VSERSFEQDQLELEAIVERLERGEVELDQLTELWERGEALCRRLAAELAEAQGRIEEVARRLDDEPGDRRE
jgi:exodeoxyribonuclease VII small subunit